MLPVSSDDPTSRTEPAHGRASTGGGLDRLDRLIVASLQINGRATWQQIARTVGTSESTVSRRAQRLLRQGLVRVTSIVDPLRCQLGYPVLLQVNCAVGAATAVANTLAARPDVRFLALLTGSFDLVVELIVTSRAHLTQVLMEQLNRVPGITRTTTENVLRTFKTSYDWSRDLLGDTRPLTDPRTPTAPAGPQPLDPVDLQLIRLLGEDGRRSFADLAAHLDISESMARRRVDALLAGGRLQVSTLVDPQLLGYGVEMFVWLTVDLARLEEVATALGAHDEVRYISATAGYSDLACEVVLRDHDDLYRFNTQVLGSLPGIRRAEVGLELQTIKRADIQVSAPPGDQGR